MLQPLTEEKIPALNLKSRRIAGLFDCSLHCLGERRGNALVGVTIKHPRILERNISKRPILLAGIAVEFPQRYLGAKPFGDFYGSIRAV